MTVVLVCLLNDNSYDELADRCSRIPKTVDDDDETTTTTTTHSEKNGDVEMKEDDGEPETNEEIPPSDGQQIPIGDGNVAETVTTTDTTEISGTEEQNMGV